MRLLYKPRVQMAFFGIVAGTGVASMIFGDAGARASGALLATVGGGFLLAIRSGRDGDVPTNLAKQAMQLPTGAIARGFRIPLRRGRERQMLLVATFALGGIIALVAGDSFTGRLAIGRWFFAFVGLGATVIAIDFARQWRSLQPGTSLTDAGILVESLGVGSFLGWENIASIRRGTFHGNRALFIDATAPSAVTRRGKGVLGLFALDRPGGGDMTIILDGMVWPGDDVAQLVTFLHEQPDERQGFFASTSAFLSSISSLVRGSSTTTA